MAVRRTESRLPDGLQASDLGQAATTANLALVSYFSSPVAVTRPQTYVLFVTDSALAGRVASYQWTFTLNGTAHGRTSDIGQQGFTPTAEGQLQVSVQARDSGGQALGTVSLTQQVFPLNPELESLITSTTANAPVAGHPETTRELINDLRLWIDQQVTPGNTDDGRLNRLLLSIAYAECLHVPPARREAHLDYIADLLEAGRFDDLVSEGEEGLGICQLRPRTLAMSLERNNQPWIPWTLLPADPVQRLRVLPSIYMEFNNLSQNDIVDLYNRLRFPRTNLRGCQQVLLRIRREFFNGQTWTALLQQPGAASEFLTQFNEGPIRP